MAFHSFSNGDFSRSFELVQIFARIKRIFLNDLRKYVTFYEILPPPKKKENWPTVKQLPLSEPYVVVFELHKSYFLAVHYSEYCQENSYFICVRCFCLQIEAKAPWQDPYSSYNVPLFSQHMHELYKNITKTAFTLFCKIMHALNQIKTPHLIITALERMNDPNWNIFQRLRLVNKQIFLNETVIDAFAKRNFRIFHFSHGSGSQTKWCRVFLTPQT